jgi:hypothetical protein
MTISYEEALATLESMFGHFNRSQLDTVLRHHEGHMEHTVETLLAHGEESPEDLLSKLGSIPKSGMSSSHRGASSASDIDADEELARQLAAEDRQHAREAASAASSNQGIGLGSAMGRGGKWKPPGERRLAASTVTAPRNKPASKQQTTQQQQPVTTGTKKGRGTPNQLPSDFLRIPGRSYPNDTTATSSTNVDAVAGEMTDEQLARMLQDELFQEELRNNPEFSHLAGRRNPRAGGGGVQFGSQGTGRSTYGGAAGGGGGVHWGERTDLFDRLSELGDTAKRRFQALAANWNQPNMQQNRTSSAVAPQNERRGLLSNDLNMEEEEEMDFVGGGRSRGDAVELGDIGGSGSKKKD